MEVVGFTNFIFFYVLVKFVPAVICPSPENCTNGNDFDPTVIGASVVHTKAWSAFRVPTDTHTAPLTISSDASKSDALLHELELVT